MVMSNRHSALSRRSEEAAIERGGALSHRPPDVE
jgi:hypothetical protein